MPRQLRRSAAAWALGLYAALTLAAPIAHLAHHTDDHTHVADSIDWAAARSARTGRVDLAQLARQLGIDADAKHAQAHRTGTRHDHDRSPPTRSSGHGANSVAHFGVALGSGLPSIELAPFLAAVNRPIAAPPRTRLAARSLAFLTSQRGQAPPVG